MSERRYIELRCTSDVGGLVRTEVLEDREHLAVPVVMLIGNSVIQASNAPTPEYIPADVIEGSLISGWNGRPAVSTHPKRGRRAVSANAPEMYESYRMGTLFNTVYEDNKLKTEAWLDVERCNALGGDAKTAIEKLTNGESIDVSVGAIVETETRNGESPSGEKYGAVWVSIDGDHLALLPSTKGACDQSMGCGAPRIAEIAKETSTMPGDSATTSTPTSASTIAVDPVSTAAPPRDFFSRLLSKFRPAMIFDDGMGDDDLRDMLTDAIRKEDPAFDWVCSVYPDAGVVIYMTITLVPNSYYGTYRYWRRTYTLAEGGKSVTLHDDAIEVQPKRVWETVKDNVEMNDDNNETVTSAERRELRAAQIETPEGGIMSVCETRKKAIDALIAAGKFKEEDRKGLEALSEDGIKSLSALTPESTPAIANASASTPVIPATLTEEQALAACPDLRSMVSKYKAAEDARKTQLVSRLKDAQKYHDETALKSKSLDQLEEIAALIGLDTPQPVDFSLRGVPSIPSSETRTAAENPPDGWLLALERGRGQSAAN